MRNNWLLVTIIFFFILLGVWGISIYRAHQPQTQEEITGIIYALAVDMDNDGHLSEADVLSGHDAVFGLNLSKVPPTLLEKFPELQSTSHGNNLYVFNGLESLARFDLDGDNEIDGEDEVYAAIEILRFKDGVLVGHTSAYAAGIRVIMFPGTVVLSDSSTRLIKIIPMRSQAFGLS